MEAGKAVIAKVFLADGSYKAFAADGTLTFAQLVRMCSEKFMLPNIADWSLYEYRETGQAEATLMVLAPGSSVSNTVSSWGAPSQARRLVFKSPGQALDKSTFKRVSLVSSAPEVSPLGERRNTISLLRSSVNIPVDVEDLRERSERAEKLVEEMRAMILVMTEKFKEEHIQVESTLQEITKKAETLQRDLDSERQAHSEAQAEIAKLLAMAQSLREERDKLQQQCTDAAQESRMGTLALTRTINDRDKKVHQLERDRDKLKKSVAKREKELKSLKADHLKEISQSSSDYRVLKDVFKKKEEEIKELREKLSAIAATSHVDTRLPSSGFSRAKTPGLDTIAAASGYMTSPMGTPITPRARAFTAGGEASEFIVEVYTPRSRSVAPTPDGMVEVTLQIVDWRGAPEGELLLTAGKIGSTSKKTINIYKDESLLSSELQIFASEGSNALLSFSVKDGPRIGELVLPLLECEAPGYDKWINIPGCSAEFRLVLCLNCTRLSMKYDVKEELGTGSIGVVSRAIERETGREVAIKAISRESIEEEGLDDLRVEIEAMRLLKNPFIVELYEIICTGATIFLVIELLAGGDLYGTISDGTPLPEKKAAELITEILTAVDFMHQNGVVHRDLKLENLLLSKDGKVKISDFGFSVKTDGKPITSMAGTPSYMAPEIILATPYDSACDIWSSGVILFILLSGTMPFFGNSVQDITRKSITGAYSFPSPEWDHISEEAKNTIKLMLEHDPKKRPTAKQCLEMPWFSNSNC